MGCLSSASSLRARARRRILMVSPTVCPVALNARLIVRTDKPCARATALGLKCSSRRFCSMNRSTASRSAGPPPGHHHHHTSVSSGRRLRRMPRACWGSQSVSGRSPRRSSRFTLQFRRPAHPRRVVRLQHAAQVSSGVYRRNGSARTPSTRAHCSPPPTGPVSAAAQAPPIDRLTIKSRSRRRQLFPACAHRLPQQPWWLPPSLEDDGWAGRRTTS